MYIREENLDAVLDFIKLNQGCEHLAMQKSLPFCKEYIKGYRTELIKRKLIMKQRNGKNWRYYTVEHAKLYNIKSYVKSKKARKTKAEMDNVPAEESVLRLQNYFDSLLFQVAR